MLQKKKRILSKKSFSSFLYIWEDEWFKGLLKHSPGPIITKLTNISWLTVDCYISAKTSTYILWLQTFHSNLLHSPLPLLVFFYVSSIGITLFSFQTVSHDLLYKEVAYIVFFTWKQFVPVQQNSTHFLGLSQMSSFTKSFLILPTR